MNSNIPDLFNEFYSTGFYCKISGKTKQDDLNWGWEIS